MLSCAHIPYLSSRLSAPSVAAKPCKATVGWGHAEVADQVTEPPQVLRARGARTNAHIPQWQRTRTDLTEEDGVVVVQQDKSSSLEAAARLARLHYRHQPALLTNCKTVHADQKRSKTRAAHKAYLKRGERSAGAKHGGCNSRQRGEGQRRRDSSSAISMMQVHMHCGRTRAGHHATHHAAHAHNVVNVPSGRALVTS